jgi:hypothetical protein
MKSTVDNSTSKCLDYLEENTNDYHIMPQRIPKQELLRHLKPKTRKPNEAERDKLAKLKAELQASLKDKPRFYEDEQLDEIKSGDAIKRLMKQQKNDKKTKVGREFQHIEDLVYIDGIKGVKKALLKLAQIARNGNSLEIKWDGSPAIIFGRDESGTFHFGDKYAKQMLTNPREVYHYFIRNEQTQDRQQFAMSMAQLFSVYARATPKNFRGFLEAGLMYKTKPPLNDTGEYYFRPNTVTYLVNKDSTLGQMIENSITGAAATASFDTLPGLGGQRRPVGDSYKAIQSGDVVIIPPTFAESVANIDANRLKLINDYLKNVSNEFEAFLSSTDLPDVKNIIYSYINSQADEPEHLHQLDRNFINWLENNDKISSDKKENLIGRVRTNPKGANAVFKIVLAIMHIKNNIIQQKEQETLAKLGIRAMLPNGQPGGEGFVHDSDGGVEPVKLVNRGTFTHANRLNESVGIRKMATVGWGRGMGHKGHMYLAQAVIEYSERIGATPYFFVSETVGEDDPLPPTVKLKIYQQVFPEHKSIFKSASSVNDVIKKLNEEKITDAVFIFGEDQVESFKYLETPSDKHLNPIHIKVISRQETDTETSELDGPRATPMRDILKDSNATSEQKFACWRDAMPDALSDRQVMALMKIAAHNMGVSIG